MKYVLGSFLLVMIFFAKAQERLYTEPLKIPLLLSGSFAELRSNHFHSGIDIKTNGQIGLPVYSIADGFVSRIKVSPTGFGNALYIDHFDGTTSVYGHLEKFRDDISRYVKYIQYQEESFSIDITVPQDKFRIVKEEIIAFSGNTGSSGGPHLHFEIRDAVTQEPLNPLEFNLNVKDKIAPKILAVTIYPLNKNSYVNYNTEKKNYKTVYYDSAYHIKGNPTIPVFGEIGFGVQADDYLDGTWSKCGINILQLKVDGETYFSIKLNRFNFDETRYINSFIDYGEYIDSHKRFIKTWKDPGNKMSIYKNAQKILNVAEGEKHNIEIIVTDTYGNTSTLNFNITGVYRDIPSDKSKDAIIFRYNQSNYFETDNIRLKSEAGSFYSNFYFKYDTKEVENDSIIFSQIHIIHDKYTPIHKAINLSIKAEKLPVEISSKALLATIDKKTGQLSSAGGNFEDGWVTTTTRIFGDYIVAVDTVAPQIKSLSIKNFNSLTESTRIRFKISDSFSGINSYIGTIDGKWVLFEYDPRISLITYTFDKERFEFGKSHTINIEVTDNKGNKSTYEGKFFK